MAERGAARAVALVSLGLLACARPRAGGAPPPRAAAVVPGAKNAGSVGVYTATWDGAGELAVTAALEGGAGARLAVDRGAERWVRDPEASGDGGRTWQPLGRHGRQFEAAACEVGACLLRYRYALRAAAERLDDLDIASVESAMVEAPPSTWLLAPAGADVRGRTVRFRMNVPPGQTFVTGLPAARGEPAAWDVTLDDLWTSPYSAFGALRVRTLEVPGGTLQVALSPGSLVLDDARLDAWLAGSARAVTAYYGAFPMPHALLLLAITGGRWVGGGRTLSGGGGTVFLRIGEQAKPQAFDEDWVLVHELVHLTFPSVGRDQDWAEEGVATYVEPFARVRAKRLSAEEAWGTLAEGLPHGLPRPGDAGLDHTHTWGRTYWGGALFWLLADVGIRERTRNTKGLEDALRGILRRGGTNAVRWPLEAIMKAGDEASGTVVLTELYEAMKASPHPVDLDALLASLGVTRVANGRAKLDDRAPLAAVRRAITYGTESP